MQPDVPPIAATGSGPSKLARIGGTLFIVSGLGSVVMTLGPLVGLRATGDELRILLATLALLVAIGAAVLSFAAPAPLGLRLTRIGLALIAVGSLLGAFQLFQLGSGSSAGVVAWLRGWLDPLLLDGLRVALILGTVAGLLGWPVTGLSLIRSGGISRAAGLLLLGGAVLWALAIVSPVLWALAFVGPFQPTLSPLVRSIDVTALRIGNVLLDLGLVGVGLLALGTIGARQIVPKAARR